MKDLRFRCGWKGAGRAPDGRLYARSGGWGWAAWVRILCAAALVFIGLAHKPPLIPASQYGQETNYVLPDGTVPVLCLSNHVEDGKTGQNGVWGSGCEVCRLGASATLPLPPATAGEPMALVIAAAMPPREAGPPKRRVPPNAAPRAPPFSGFII